MGAGTRDAFVVLRSAQGRLVGPHPPPCRPCWHGGADGRGAGGKGAPGGLIGRSLQIRRGCNDRGGVLARALGPPPFRARARRARAALAPSAVASLPPPTPRPLRPPPPPPQHQSSTGAAPVDPVRLLQFALSQDHSHPLPPPRPHPPTARSPCQAEPTSMDWSPDGLPSLGKMPDISKSECDRI